MRIFNKLFGKSKRLELEPLKNNKTTYVPDFNSLKELSEVSKTFEWVFNTNKTISIEAAKTIERLLNSKTTFNNTELNNSIKHIRLEKSDLLKFDRFDNRLKQSLLCVASMNRNGYVREEALKQMSENYFTQNFSFILFRLGDWVPSIRNQAEKIIQGMIHKVNPELLIRHYKVIDWLLKVQRNDLEQIYNEISKYIFSKKNVTHILNSTSNCSEGERYFIFKNLINRHLLSSNQLESILTDKNFLIRLLAIRNINLINNPKILKRLLEDKSLKIRQYSIDQIPVSEITTYKVELLNLLFDNSRIIRLQSRSLISKIEKVNYYDVYLKRILENPNVGSIIGLSEVGDKEDIKYFTKLLTSKRAKHRASALFAISIFDYDKAKELSFKLINEQSNKVKKICSSIIPKEKEKQDLEKLRFIYRNGNIETKRFILKIINQFRGWSVAGDFLIGLLESDKKINDISLAFLNTWYNYTIRLGTEQNPKEKEYVLNIFNKLPNDLKEKYKLIKFIFARE
jgi:hypothetical protein